MKGKVQKLKEHTKRLGERKQGKVTLAIPRLKVRTQDNAWKKASTKIKYCSSSTPCLDKKETIPCSRINPVMHKFQFNSKFINVVKQT